MQALPLIESGAADAFDLTNKELALACASHSGEDEHVKTAAGMLKRQVMIFRCWNAARTGRPTSRR